MKKPITFTIKITGMDLFRYLIYHNYVSIMGGITLFFSLGAWIGAWATWGTVAMNYTVLLIMCGFLFTIWNPFLLLLKAFKQAKSKGFRKPLEYEFAEEGMTVSQGELVAIFSWTDIRKVVETPSSMIIYMDRIRAYVLPKRLLDSQEQDLRDLLKQNLEIYKIKRLK